MKANPVLIVEDETAIRETLKFAFEMSGFDALTAEHGGQALELLRKGVRPSVVILDLMMPIMDGWQFIDALESSPDDELRRTPVVVITALGERARALEARDVVKLVLKKPLDLGSLMSLVGEYHSAGP